MKKLCYLMICCILFSHELSYAVTVEIYDVKPTELDWAVSLVSENPNSDITLDCASFIHNLNIKYKNTVISFPLDESECFNSFKFLSELPNERRCLNFDNISFNFNDCSATD